MEWQYIVKNIERTKSWPKTDIDITQFSQYLNEMGTDGWELVSCIVGGLNNSSWLAVLKKPK
jgi:hypothetical protein